MITFSMKWSANLQDKMPKLQGSNNVDKSLRKIDALIE